MVFLCVAGDVALANTFGVIGFARLLPHQGVNLNSDS